jgi:PAS domain S-box-containing protein
MIVISRKIRRHHWRISRAAFVFLCVHIFYLTWINDIHPVYFALIPIVVVSAPIFFTRYSLLIPFLSLVVILTVLSGGMSGYSEKMLFYFLLIGLSLPVSFFNLFLFRRIIKKLQFSDYVLNNIDALVLTSNANGEVTFVSKNVNRILGYSRQEVLNRGWWNLRLRREATDAELDSFQEHILAKADTEEGYDVLCNKNKEIVVKISIIDSYEGDDFSEDIISNILKVDDLVLLEHVLKRREYLPSEECNLVEIIKQKSVGLILLLMVILLNMKDN